MKKNKGLFRMYGQGVAAVFFVCAWAAEQLDSARVGLRGERIFRAVKLGFSLAPSFSSPYLEPQYALFPVP